MQQRTIYKITVSYLNSTFYLRQSEPVATYYSNLKRTVEAIQTTLVVQGWDESRVNYSAVYRALNERGKYVESFNAEGVRFFKITIEKIPLNPAFSNLGIDIHPNKAE